MGRYQNLQKADVKIMVQEDASLTNPEKGRTGKRKKNIQTAREMRRPVITNA